MAQRTNESPMDFQWQSGHGPSTLDSPFMKYTAETMHSHDGLAGQKREFILDSSMSSLDADNGYTGSFDHSDSPKKPLLPALHNLDSQSPWAPSTPSMRTSFQFRNPAFTTPRRNIDTDFSSGPENQSSPLADNEDTPEPPVSMSTAHTRNALVMFQGNRSEKKSPTKSIFGPHTLGRETPRRHHTGAVARRVLKRRRRDADGRDIRLSRRRPSDESDYEDHDRHSSSSASANPITSPKEIGLIASILTFVDAHPDLPDVLSRYAQFLLNLFFVALLMFLVYCFLATIRSDVDEASREVAAETMVEMIACTREFKSNKCDSAERVPAMESMCNSWQKCMDRDPAMVGRARVSAQTFAEIITSFAEGISYKTMVCCSISRTFTEQSLTCR